MKRYILFFAFAVLSVHLYSQAKEKTDPRSLFVEAESYLLYEEYEEALPIYLKLLKADPDNDNLNFKVGLCYLNIKYEKEKSIKYLEQAVKNINPKAKSNNFKERQAPLDALFYLGNAYRINNQLDKALEMYNEFKKNLDPNIYDDELVNEQIQIIERAKSYLSRPVFFIATNLGEPINSKYAEFNAVVSGDETVLVYNVKLPFYEALYFSKKINGRWSAPENIIPQLGVDGDVYSTGLSYDGKELIIYRNDGYDGNLYVTRYVNNRWTPIIRLNDNINTKYWESHGSLSSDGKTFYFTSNRKGGYGGLDIYTATRDDINSNNWTNVTNLGPVINTKYNEESPFISQDNKVLYFSSYGHFNMGGYDIFYSSLLENGQWSAPLNMGYPINSTDDDVFFVPVQNGTFGYISKFYHDSYGKSDIYRVELFSEQHPRKFLLKGLISFSSNFIPDNSQKIYAYIIDKIKKDTLDRFIIDPLSPSFETQIKAGKYQLAIEGEGFEDLVKDFAIDKNQKDSDVSIEANIKGKPKTVAPEAITKVQEKGQIPFEKTFYKVFDGRKILIPIPLPPNTKLDIAITTDSTSPYNDSFVVTEKSNLYEYHPVPGKNVLKFKTIDDKEIKEGEIIIYYEPLVITDQKQFAEELEKRKSEIDYLSKFAYYLADDSLKDCISSIDIHENKIVSLTEFADYLKYQAKCFKNNSSEIDSLMKLLLESQKLISNLLLQAVYDNSKERLHAISDSLRNNNKIETVSQLSDTLLTLTMYDTLSRYQLLNVSSYLAWNGSAYYHLIQLRKVATGRFKTTLDTLNLLNNNIYTALDLLKFLIEKRIKNDFSLDEIMLAYFNLPFFEGSTLNLVETMKAYPDATKDIITFLDTINPYVQYVESFNDLAKLFLQKYKKMNVKCEDLLTLYVKVLEDEALRQMIYDLRRFAYGDIKNIVFSIDIKKDKIKNLRDLINVVINKYQVNNEDWIKLNLKVASKNILKVHQWEGQKVKVPLFSPLAFGISISLIILIIVVMLLAYRKFNDVA